MNTRKRVGLCLALLLAAATAFVAHAQVQSDKLTVKAIPDTFEPNPASVQQNVKATFSIAFDDPKQHEEAIKAGLRRQKMVITVGDEGDGRFESVKLTAENGAIVKITRTTKPDAFKAQGLTFEIAADNKIVITGDPKSFFFPLVSVTGNFATSGKKKITLEVEIFPRTSSRDARGSGVATGEIQDSLELLTIETDKNSDAVMTVDGKTFEAELAPADEQLNPIPADFNFVDGFDAEEDIQRTPPTISFTARVPATITRVETQQKPTNPQSDTVYWWVETNGTPSAPATLAAEGPALNEVDKEHKTTQVTLTLPPKEPLGARFKVHVAILSGTDLIEKQSNWATVIPGKAAKLEVLVGNEWKPLVVDYQEVPDNQKPKLSGVAAGAKSPDESLLVVHFRARDAWGNVIRPGTQVQYQYRPKPSGFYQIVKDALWKQSNRAKIVRDSTDVATNDAGEARLAVQTGPAKNDSELFIGITIDGISAFLGDPVLNLKIERDGFKMNGDNTGKLRARVTVAGTTPPSPVANLPVTWLATKGSLRQAGQGAFQYGAVHMTTDQNGYTEVLEFSNKYYLANGDENTFIRPALGQFDISLKAAHQMQVLVKEKYDLPTKEVALVRANDPFLVSKSPEQTQYSRFEVPRPGQVLNDGLGNQVQIRVNPTEPLNVQENGVFSMLARESWGKTKTAFRFATPKDDELFDAASDKEASFTARSFEFQENKPPPARTDDNVLFGRHKLTTSDNTVASAKAGKATFNYLRCRAEYVPERQPKGLKDEVYIGMWEETNSFRCNYVHGSSALESFGEIGIAEVDFTDPQVMKGLDGQRITISLSKNPLGDDFIYFTYFWGSARGDNLNSRTTSANVGTVNPGDVLEVGWQYRIHFVPPKYDQKIAYLVPYVKNLTTGIAPRVQRKLTRNFKNGDLLEWPIPAYRFNYRTSAISCFLGGTGGVADPRHKFNSGLDLSRLVNGKQAINGAISTPAAPADPALYGPGVVKHEEKIGAFGKRSDKHFQEIMGDEGDANGVFLGWDNTQPEMPNLKPEKSVWELKAIKGRMRAKTVSIITDTYPVTFRQVVGEVGGFLKGFFWEQDDRFASSQVGEFVGGLLVIGDIGRLIKQIARMVAGDADNPPNYIELTCSAIGVCSVLLPGIGQGATAGLKTALGIIKKQMAVAALAKGAIHNLAISFVIEEVAQLAIQAILIMAQEDDNDFNVGQPPIPGDEDKY